VLAATHRRAQRAGQPQIPSSGVEVTAARIFTSLRPLHALHIDDLDLLGRAAAGLRFIRSSGGYSGLEHELFGAALSELDVMDAFVVESAACHAADFAVLGEPEGLAAELGVARRRALWLAAILRVADGFCALGGPEAQGVYAVWTGDVLYLEFDEAGAPDGQCQRARTRVAALEAVSGRTVCVASSSARRGAA
jgi:hypothetical protein